MAPRGPVFGTRFGWSPAESGDKQHFEPLVFVPLFEYAGLVVGPGGVGFYAGTSRVGGGLYANVTSMLSCEGK